MRTNLLAVLFIGALSTGCAVHTQGDDEESPSAITEDAITKSDKLVGDYVSADGAAYPKLTLAAGPRTYVWDTGIRCITTPCPSGETGKWQLYRGVPSGRTYLALTSSVGKQHWFQVDFDGTGATKGLVGIWGETTKFVPFRKAVTGCEVIRCSAGHFCAEDAKGQGSCIAYPTCATTKCGGGNYCVDAPIVCVKAPCAPTAPSCTTCPKPGTWINCMPGPSGTDPRCAAKASIEANCPDVGFAY